MMINSFVLEKALTFVTTSDKELKQTFGYNASDFNVHRKKRIMYQEN